MIRVLSVKGSHDYTANRFSTDEEYNNLCVWQDRTLVALFAEGQWVGVEFR